MPWLETSRVHSANYRLYRQFLFIFFAAVVGLGYLGSQEPTGGYVIATRILTIYYYFAFFFVILPVLGLFEKTKPLPNSISESVLRHRVPAGASAPRPPDAQRQ
jgi:ubiquinol-cytochrome c reductase cytochrome b/c1 subunit